MNRVSTYVTVVAALAALLAAGCGGREESGVPAAQGEAAPAVSPAGGAEASHAEGAVTGSYADWCSEHGVPESACTRCDATLIAAFKATGDWCEEHGLPKSQCLACDPQLKIVRPPKPEGTE